MLGSDHEGEIVNAARLATKLVKSWNSTIAEVLNFNAPPPGGTQTLAGGGVGGKKTFTQKDLDDAYHRGFTAGVKSGASATKSANRTWKQWAKDRVNDDAELLSQWEYEFFTDFAGGRFATPTVKQRAIFLRVAGRLDLEPPESTDPQTEVPF
jgi:hypothetical protein